MVEYHTPGVYIDEVGSTAGLITGVDTSTAAFVGETQTGDPGVTRLITSYHDFEWLYGEPLDDRHLARSVHLFFANGGTRLYIAPVNTAAGMALNHSAYRDAFGLLDAIDDINLVAVPGVADPGMLEFGAEYCRQRGDCFFIADMPPGVDTVAEAEQAASSPRDRTSYAAQYFPWLRIYDQNSGAKVAAPPSGAVAGVYARTDRTRGVWKAPAGREAELRGVAGLSLSVTDSEQIRLNPLGVNVLRDNVADEILLWGARTMDSTDPEYRYVPVRRMAIFVEESVSRDTQWAVFEPNTPALWSRLKQSVSNFMFNLFRQGAITGRTVDEAYFVKCGYDTMTQADIEQGTVIVEIGFAPLRPAEFVVIRIRQKRGR